MEIKVYPNCKINIGLNITERRPDGYHNLQTVFYPVPLCDELFIQTAPSDSFSLDGLALEGDPEDNLVLKVVRLLRQQGIEVPPLAIQLRKIIPSGAGLGGGSSDAAFTLKALNEMLSLGLSDEAMEAMLSPLGADCPFFIRNHPVYAEGIGNIFTPTGLDLAGWHLLLVKPDEFVSTREAYSAVHPHWPEHPLCEIISRPVEQWPGTVVNDFEASVFPLHPVISRLREACYAQGAVYAAMSGSGSTVYGLFRHEPPTDFLSLFPGAFHYVCVL